MFIYIYTPIYLYVYLVDSVGTLIACEEETDAFAFGSIIPLPSCKPTTTNNDTTASTISRPAGVLVNDVLRAVNSMKTINQSTKTMFQKCLADTDSNTNTEHATGLFVHTRVSNLPTELLAPLHKNIYDDYQWSLKHKTEDVELDSQLALFKSMKYLLLLSPCTESAGNESLYISNSNSNKNKSKSNSNSNSKSNKKQKSEKTKLIMNADRTGSATSGILFDYFEDDMYHTESVASISYSSSISNSNNEAKQGMMMASIIPINKYRKVITEIEKILS